MKVTLLSSTRFGHTRMLLLAVLVLLGASAAFADVFGRLQFSVKNADDEKPVAGATITLHDTAGVHADMTPADRQGRRGAQPAVGNSPVERENHLPSRSKPTRVRCRSARIRARRWKCCSNR